MFRRKKTGTKSRKRRRTGIGLRERLSRVFGASAAKSWKRRGLYALLAVAIGLTVWSSLSIRRGVLDDERLHLEHWRIVLGDLPDWVTPEIAQSIESVDLRHPDTCVTVLDHGSIDWVRDRLEASPWVRTVRELRLRFPTRDTYGVIEAELWLRRPVAIVIQAGGYYLADAEARRLGEGYAESPSDWFQVPVVTGFQNAGDLPALGEAWASQDLRQGVEVARILREDGIFADFAQRPIDAIDLSNLHGILNPSESEIILWCRNQRLTWGRSPLSAGARTIPIADLLSNLRQVLSNPDVYGEYAEIQLHRRWEAVTGVRG